MSDQTNIFQNTNTETPPNNQAPNSNGANVQTDAALAHLLSNIKNERGEQKYKTVQEALNGLQNAQDFIPTLKSDLKAKDDELARLRAEAEKVKTLEEAIAALTAQQAPPVQNTTAPVFDEQKLAELVNRQLSAQEQAKLANANIQSVVATLQQSFGADAEKKFYDKAVEMGLTPQEFNDLAAKTPKAVLTMLGITGQAVKQPNTSVTNGTVNTSAFTPNQETYIGRNTKTALIGATTQDLKEASDRAKKMVEELHANGKSVNDLVNPKEFFKHFGS